MDKLPPEILPLIFAEVCFPKSFTPGSADNHFRFGICTLKAYEA